MDYSVKNICLYRISHIENIPHILKYGIVHQTSPNSNPDFINIGDTSLINFRKGKHINVKGKDIILGDFIPFYFGIRMPMLYVIQHGGNYVPNALKAEDIIYIAVSLNKIIEGNYTYYFSNGHATDFFTSFFDSNDIKDIPHLIDWKAVTTRQWAGDGIETDLKRRKQAEFLIKEDIPPKCIVGYGCYNDKAKNKLIDFGVSEKLIKIIPNAYY